MTRRDSGTGRRRWVGHGPWRCGHCAAMVRSPGGPEARRHPPRAAAQPCYRISRPGCVRAGLPGPTTRPGPRNRWRRAHESTRVAEASPAGGTRRRPGAGRMVRRGADAERSPVRRPHRAAGPPMRRAAEEGRPFIRGYAPSEVAGDGQNWAIVQDPRGVIYVGSAAGVLEFDGVDLAADRDRRSSNTVRSLAIDDAGRIYVGGVGEFGYLAPDATGELRFVSAARSCAGRRRPSPTSGARSSPATASLFQTEQAIFRWANDAVRGLPAGVALQPRRRSSTASSTSRCRKPGSTSSRATRFRVAARHRSRSAARSTRSCCATTSGGCSSARVRTGCSSTTAPR